MKRPEAGHFPNDRPDHLALAHCREALDSKPKTPSVDQPCASASPGASRTAWSKSWMACSKSPFMENASPRPLSALTSCFAESRLDWIAEEQYCRARSGLLSRLLSRYCSQRR